MSLGLQGIQALLAAKIGAVAGVGMVYRYKRLITEETGIFTDATETGILNYWTVAPAEVNPVERERHPGSHDKATYKYDVDAFYAASGANATEVAFVALVLLVMDTFETGDKKLSGQVTECWPPVWQQNDYRTFGNVLCHHARLLVTVREHPENQ